VNKFSRRIVVLLQVLAVAIYPLTISTAGAGPRGSVGVMTGSISHHRHEESVRGTRWYKQAHESAEITQSHKNFAALPDTDDYEDQLCCSLGCGSYVAILPVVMATPIPTGILVSYLAPSALLDLSKAEALPRPPKTSV